MCGGLAWHGDVRAVRTGPPAKPLDLLLVSERKRQGGNPSLGFNQPAQIVAPHFAIEDATQINGHGHLKPKPGPVSNKVVAVPSQRLYEPVFEKQTSVLLNGSSGSIVRKSIQPNTPIRPSKGDLLGRRIGLWLK
jgi:hypothetical protein